MGVIKVKDNYNIKNGTDYLPGKYDLETTAEYVFNNFSDLDMDSLWIYTLNNNKDAEYITMDDVNKFRPITT